jgi:hypothetical protein
MRIGSAQPRYYLQQKPQRQRVSAAHEGEAKIPELATCGSILGRLNPEGALDEARAFIPAQRNGNDVRTE